MLKEFVGNPFNYTASKDRLLPSLVDRMDYKKDIFVDLFCGSGVVGTNFGREYKKVIFNDGCEQMIGLLKYFKEHDTEEIVEQVLACVKKFNLSKSNKEEFLVARNVYNNGKRDPILLYCLIAHAFSYNVVFRKDGGFSVPSGAGRSYFNPAMKKKLVAFCDELHKLKNVEFISQKLTPDFLNGTADLNDTLNLSDLMVYADPPYFTSDGACSRSYGLKWTEEHDLGLMRFLDRVNEAGGSFAMSNTFENNGHVNENLPEWAKKYKVHHLACDYYNCHHQRKNAGKTDEVLITNY